MHDSLDFPSDRGNQLTLDNVVIRSKNLKRELQKLNVKMISKAFPQHTDTLKYTTNPKGIRVVQPNLSGVYRLHFNTKDSIDIAVERLSNLKSVLFVEKHSNVKLHVDDEYYPQQWHLNNTGQSGGTPDVDIDGPEAWSIYTGSSSIKLGIIDTGVETNHEDLSGKSSGDLPEYDPVDGYSHGTHVAGISGAKHNNIGKVKGVDAQVQIHSGKVFSGKRWDYASGSYVPNWAGNANAYNEIVAAVNSGANVLNCSWGSDDYSSIIRSAFAYAYKMNCVSVVSMGNDYSGSPHFPAAYPRLVAVGNINRYNNRSSSSNWGPHIDVAAPGTAVMSTILNNGYAEKSGT
jgi:hypothetical protein